MKQSELKKLIKEAIADRIKMIDEAGDIAALEAKIKKVDEDIKDAMSVKPSIDVNAVLTDIAKQVKWHGQAFDVVTWKRLCMASWLREKNEQPQLIPALDGKGLTMPFNLFCYVC